MPDGLGVPERRRRIRSFGRAGTPIRLGGGGQLVAEHRGRLLAVSVVVLVLFAVLVGRLGQVQLVEGADTAVSAAGTNTRTLPVPAVRGRILDRHGVDRKSVV